MTTTWQYADYISYTDNSSRLARLRLHIQEVAQRTISIEGRSSTVSAVNQQYLNSLKGEETELAQLVEPTRTSTYRRNPVTFRRD